MGLDDVFTTNGSCCSIRNTPQKTEKGNTFVDGIYVYIYLISVPLTPTVRRIKEKVMVNSVDISNDLSVALLN